MARCTFGGGPADFVMVANNTGFIRLSSATLYVWTAETGGTQITDLLLNGSPVTVIPVGSDGQVPDFSGPNTGDAEVWVSAGPVGPRVRMTSGVSSATDVVTSGLVTNPASATSVALSATYASRENSVPLEAAVELQPMVAIGHSYIGAQNQTLNARSHERVARRLGMGTITNQGQPGKYARLVSMSALAGTYRWAPRTRALAYLVCTINDIQLHGDDAAGIREYGWSWDSLLSRLTCNATIPVNRRDWVFTSGWSSEAITAAVDNTSTGGRRFYASALNEYCEFSYQDSGTGVTIRAVAKSAAGGVITFTEGATTLGTIDLTQTAMGDCPRVLHIPTRGVGAHTIRGTITTAGRVDLDSFDVPALYPTSGVVVGEGIVERTPDIGPTPYAALLTARKAQLAAIVANYPSFVFCDVSAADVDGQSWNSSLMLVEATNKTHPNDWGCAFTASRVIAALRTLSFTSGFNILDAGEGFYVNPTAPAIPVGGSAGSGTPLAGEFYDTVTRDDAAVPGNLGSGQAWVISGTATWGPLNGSMVQKSGGHSVLTVDTAAANGVLRAVMGPRTVGTIYGGPAFRGTDSANTWYVSFRNVGNQYVYALTSRTAGAPTEVAYTNTVAAPGDLVEVTLSGTSISLAINGIAQTLNLVAGGTASSYTSTTRQTATIHGWQSNFTSIADKGGFTSWSFDV